MNGNGYLIGINHSWEYWCNVVLFSIFFLIEVLEDLIRCTRFLLNLVQNKLLYLGGVVRKPYQQFFSRIDSNMNTKLSITNSLFSLFAAINIGKSILESCFFTTFVLSLIFIFYLFKSNFIVIFIAILSLLLLCNMFSVALMYHGFVSYFSVLFFWGGLGEGVNIYIYQCTGDRCRNFDTLPLHLSNIFFIYYYN